ARDADSSHLALLTVCPVAHWLFALSVLPNCLILPPFLSLCCVFACFFCAFWIFYRLLTTILGAPCTHNGLAQQWTPLAACIRHLPHQANTSIYDCC
ncbi:hypothetical protein CPB85DRAFT_1394976, partial [Mucidula mucida]